MSGKYISLVGKNYVHPSAKVVWGIKTSKYLIKPYLQNKNVEFCKRGTACYMLYIRLDTFLMPHFLKQSWGPILHILGEKFGKVEGHFSKEVDRELEMVGLQKYGQILGSQGLQV